LIIGGGLIGVDIATALIPLNNQVIIVKKTTNFGEDIQFNDIDLIVVSTAMKSYIPLKNEFENSTLTYIVGDALKVGKAQDAIHTAYALAIKL